MNRSSFDPKLLLIVALLSCGTSLDAEPAASSAAATESTPLPRPTNAALIYWQAFAQIPELKAADKKVLKAVEEPGNPVPLDRTAATALTKRAASSLEELHRAASLPECDWGLDFSMGPGVTAAHLSKVLSLSKLALLRARLRWETGRSADAVDDLAAVLQLSRHTGGPVLIPTLVQNKVEELMVDTVAPALPRLDDAALQRLATVLRTAGSGQSVLDALAQERRLRVGWLRAKVEAAAKADPNQFARDRQDILARIFSDPIAEERIKPLARTLTTPAAFLKAIDGLDRDYARLMDLLSPPFEGETKAEAFLQSLVAQKKNPFSFRMLPAYLGFFDREMKQKIRYAMLQAAIAIQLDAPEQFASFKDPLGGEPFEYQKLPGGGFELKSKGLFEGTPISLVFGAGKEASP